MISGYVVSGNKEMLLFEQGMSGADVTECTITYCVNEVDSASITLPASNTKSKFLRQKNHIIRLYDDNRLIFSGDINGSPNFDIWGNINFQLDGALGWMNDIVKAPFFVDSSMTMSPEVYLTRLIEQYNQQVSEDRFLWLGNVNVPGNVVADHGEEYTSILDLFRELSSNKGGYYYVTYNKDTPPQIHYVDYPSTASLQVLEFGVNELSLEDELDFEDYASRVYAVGKDGARMSGGDYIVDQDAEYRWGRVDYPFKVDSDIPSEIKSAAEIMLKQKKEPVRTIQMTAVDLAALNHSYRYFSVGTVARAIDQKLGIDVQMVVQSVKKDLINKSNTVVTFGKAPRTLTGMLQ